MSDLAEEIHRLEAIRGAPLVVTLDPPVPDHVQRLYATLGVTVRFKAV